MFAEKIGRWLYQEACETIDERTAELIRSIEVREDADAPGWESSSEEDNDAEDISV